MTLEKYKDLGGEKQQNKHIKSTGTNTVWYGI